MLVALRLEVFYLTSRTVTGHARLARDSSWYYDEFSSCQGLLKTIVCWQVPADFGWCVDVV